MKNLILCAIASLFLFTSCFEKEEEVTVVPEEEIEVAPVEGNVMECEKTLKFIEEINSYPTAREGERKGSIKKYSFRDGEVYWLRPSSEEHSDGFVIDGKCNIICEWVVVGETGCNDWNNSTVEYIETVWQDQR